MFKKFVPKDDVSGKSKVKSSVQRGIRAKILEQYPALNPYIEELIPKKDPLVLVKCHDRINVVMVNDQLLFFNHHDGPYYPTLQILHKYPDIMPKVQVDRGAIKFVLSGANIMCPGLTSKGARLDTDLPVDTPVAVLAEGKEHALALGELKMSTSDIKLINKGVGVELVHFINDGLWHAKIEA
ncbi:Malignant T-cell-amplified sequence 1 [Geranomyces michiganensis]|nr:Malignant T-cell-amplified sequence 1 [Geranomyces michiganensis]